MYNNFLKYCRAFWLLLFAVTLANCSGSDDNTEPEEQVQNNEYKTQRFTIVNLSSKVDVSTGATYNWAAVNTSSQNYSLANVTSKEALFAAAEIGTYEFKVTITDKGNTQTQTIKVLV